MLRVCGGTLCCLVQFISPAFGTELYCAFSMPITWGGSVLWVMRLSGRWEWRVLSSGIFRRHVPTFRCDIVPPSSRLYKTTRRHVPETRIPYHGHLVSKLILFKQIQNVISISGNLNFCTTVRKEHYATSRKVVGSISDDVTVFFSRPNTSSRIMAPRSAQSLTEMSTRKLPGDKGLPARKAGDLICEPIKGLHGLLQGWL
jgi:hypothetical protein